MTKKTDDQLEKQKALVLGKNTIRKIGRSKSSSSKSAVFRDRRVKNILDEVSSPLDPEQERLEAEILKKFVKKLDIENKSGRVFTVWLTNEQVYNTSKDDQV